MADPDPSSKHPIHLLIGADLYGSLLLGDIRKGPVGTPTAQSTLLGWIISGPTGTSQITEPSSSMHICPDDNELQSVIQQFWMDETIPDKTPPLTEDEAKCEQHFTDTHERDPSGRYIVRMPFKTSAPPEMGESLHIASKLYAKTAVRLSQQPALATAYHAFLAEYEELGHMHQVDSSEFSSNKPVYIPHHAVLREGSSSSPLRVVFNASCRTSNGTSLNDHLLIGQKLQQDLSAVITRWRAFQYVYTADIAKMYRQILVHPSEQNYQRILWQPPGTSSVNHYRLSTVTYGTACAPYLALRVLHQLSVDEGGDFPLARPIFQDMIYVDDALFGADDIDNAIDIRNQLIALMQRGKFELRKWAANRPELLTDIPLDMRQSDLALKSDASLKVLGLLWSPTSDEFRFKVSPCHHLTNTKRSVLSVIARLFDPLGWVAPVVITAKIILQEIWIAHIEWDDPLPADILQRWISYCQDLPMLERLRLPRWTGLHHHHPRVEIHGFADASKRAYAAVVYLRVSRAPGDAQVTLLCAKTKVSPLKTISIPRLELNATVLLSRLILWVIHTLRLTTSSIYGWTDSTVALAWIRQHPSKWRTYVANRVSEIQTTNPPIDWRHVRSSENPADCASRGLSASALVNHPLWFTGPSWLRQGSSSWPEQDSQAELTSAALLEQASSASTNHILPRQQWDLPDHVSTWTRLIRITAYIFRFVHNLRKRREGLPLRLNSLDATETINAELFWFKYLQCLQFPDELTALRKGTRLAKSSRLISLHPFIDDDQIIRLGGRLANAPLSFSERHPIILADHRIVHLLIDRAHRSTLHGGAQLTLRLLRQRYWIVSARSHVKRHIRQCVTCVRHRASTEVQQMGSLPEKRVTPSTPFTTTGVDYAGPILLTARAARGHQATKHYIAIFVCFATKAIHLECVDDYSTAGFLAAFARFTSRRGLPVHIYSDNGTNFQGADKELRRAFQTVINDPHLKDHLSEDHITWHYSPASAPHFGGLWEAGVKSVKHHLKRVVGNHTLSRAEFQTLLCRIEACLNSRPLTPLSDDPDDLSALTPGHFIIGRPIVSVPEPSLLDVRLNVLSRWQLVQRLHEQFWRTWSQDYLHSLQQRGKWRDPTQNLAINDLVLIKNNLLPPAKWALGRVIKTHPGADGLVRVASIRTATSVFTRPITQLCKLPIAHDSSAADATAATTDTESSAFGPNGANPP